MGKSSDNIREIIILKKEEHDPIKDLKGRTIRGGFIAVSSQPVKFLLRTGSLVLLARLLVPEEFGLVGMVTALTGVIGLFKDAGLSMVTVQREEITDDQLSTLFWINIGVGFILTGFSIAIAPILVSFYREPRLYWITVALGTAFIFNAAATQHQALLNRHMRYVVLVVIDLISLAASSIAGIIMALKGFGYWALVGMQVVLPAANAVCVWLAIPWIPSMPRRKVGTRSMLRFGGTVTVNSIVAYAAYNLDKVLLGRYWGAEALGFYGRAYQLFNLPLNSLNSAVGSVAFPALSRLQNDPDRFRNYFLKGYSMVLAITIPFVVACALFADDMVKILLGSRWKDAATIFRFLAPTGLALALINPHGPSLMARGQVGRSLKMALIIAPVVIAGYVVGLRYGPNGVAIGFSVGMTVLVVPMIMLAIQGTSISLRDIFQAVSRPFLSGVVSLGLVLGVNFFLCKNMNSYYRLIFGGGVLFISYLWMLLYAMKQKKIYTDLFKDMIRRS